MNVANSTTADVAFPNVYTGTAGREGDRLAFFSAVPVQRTISGTVDGVAVRASIQPDPSFDRRRGGLLIATILP